MDLSNRKIAIIDLGYAGLPLAFEFGKQRSVLERRSGKRLNIDFLCGYGPERVNPGDKVNTLIKIKNICNGSVSDDGRSGQGGRKHPAPRKRCPCQRAHGHFRAFGRKSSVQATISTTARPVTWRASSSSSCRSTGLTCRPVLWASPFRGAASTSETSRWQTGGVRLNPGAFTW